MTIAGHGHNDLLVPELLHEVNERIREMAADFALSAGDDLDQEYLCECGCGQWVSLSVSEFDDRITAERPVTVQGHVIAQAQATRRLSRVLREESAALRAEARQKRRKSDELANRNPTPHTE